MALGQGAEAGGTGWPRWLVFVQCCKQVPLFCCYFSYLTASPASSSGWPHFIFFLFILLPLPPSLPLPPPPSLSLSFFLFFFLLVFSFVREREREDGEGERTGRVRERERAQLSTLIYSQPQLNIDARQKTSEMLLSIVCQYVQWEHCAIDISPLQTCSRLNFSSFSTQTVLQRTSVRCRR